MAFIGPLEDRIRIRELQESFADAINRKAKEEWLTFWADDAVWVTGGLTAKGKQEIFDQWEKFYSPFNPNRNNETRFYKSTPAALTIDANSAWGRSYLEVLVIFTGSQKIFYYTCDELYIRQNDKWLIVRRQSSKFHPRDAL